MNSCQVESADENSGRFESSSTWICVVAEDAWARSCNWCHARTDSCRVASRACHRQRTFEGIAQAKRTFERSIERKTSSECWFVQSERTTNSASTKTPSSHRASRKTMMMLPDEALDHHRIRFGRTNSVIHEP